MQKVVRSVFERTGIPRTQELLYKNSLKNQWKPHFHTIFCLFCLVVFSLDTRLEFNQFSILINQQNKQSKAFTFVVFPILSVQDEPKKKKRKKKYVYGTM